MSKFKGIDIEKVIEIYRKFLKGELIPKSQAKDYVELDEKKMKDAIPPQCHGRELREMIAKALCNAEGIIKNKEE